MRKKSFTLFALTLATVSALSCLSVQAAGWQRDARGWWYSLDNGSYCRNQWFLDRDGQYYYFDNGGYMVANQWIGNYYLGSSGAMLTNTITPDGYTVGPDGAWIPRRHEDNKLSGEVLLYLSSSSHYAAGIGNTWTIAGDWSVIGVDGGATFESTQQLTVTGSTNYYRVQEGTGSNIPISRTEFEEKLKNRSLGYEGFKMDLENNVVINAYCYD